MHAFCILEHTLAHLHVCSHVHIYPPQYIGQKYYVPLSEHPYTGKYECDSPNVTDCLAEDGRHLRSDMSYQTPLEGLVVEVVR